MVQLRVDVEAARARAEFNATDRSVRNLGDGLNAAQRQADQLGDELTVATARAAQATREFEAAERAADDAADEMNRLRQQVDALGSSAPAALVRQLRQAEDAVRAAEREEQRLRDRMEEATQEQHRLNRAFDDGGDEVRRITRELALAAAEANRLRRIMDDTNRRAANPLRGAQRGLAGFRAQVNRVLSGGGGLRDALGNALRSAWAAMPVEVKGAIIAAGGAMALIFASAVGAAVNAALLGALGVGVLAAVVAVAAKSSDAVQAAFSNTFSSIGEEIAGFARDVATGPLIRSAEIFGDAWRAVSEDVRGAFGDVAKHIEPLSAGLAKLVENVMPGLREGLQAAGPVLDELAAALPAIGTAISDMFHDLSEGGAAQGAVKGMRVLAAAVIGTFRVIGVVVGWLSRQFNTTTNFIADMLTVLSKLPVVGHLFEGAAQSARDFANAGSGAAFALDGTGMAAEDSAASMGRQADATSRAAKAAMDLSTRMSALIDQELGASNASIQYEAAIDAITEAFKENGRTIDITNAKGRANVEAINAVIAAADRERQANIERGMAVADANAKYSAHIEQIRAMLRALGLNAAQIDAVVGAWARVPREVTTTYKIKVQDSPSSPNYNPKAGLNVARAAGGPVQAGHGYIVGEKRAEWFVPTTDGMILPRVPDGIRDAMDAARTAGARSGVTQARSAAATAGPTRVDVELVSTGSRSVVGLDALFKKWLDDQFISGLYKLKVVNGRIQPT